MKNKIAYVGMSADIIHEGHINILKHASKFGKVAVGLLTDEAISTYKKIPILSYHQREIILKNIKQVHKVIPQRTHDYSENLLKIRPDFVVHGNDWRKGVQKKIRQKVLHVIKKWPCKLIEPKYTENISSSNIKSKIIKAGTNPQTRVSRLKRILEIKKIVRVLESHNSLTGLIIENLNIMKNNKFYEFDGMWSSSLTDSLTRGKPDNQSVDYSTRMLGLSEIMDVTTKPVIFDADNGGRLEHIPYLVKSLERVGVSAIIFEDKKGLKKNSLFSDQKGAAQDSIKNFCNKISVAKTASNSKDLFIIARVESFILKQGLNDALKRAEAYSRSGADAILIHSKENNPNEIFSFAKKFSKSRFFKPLVAVPSTYSKTNEKQLIKNGFRIVIYANQMLRAAYPAMYEAAESILKNQRAFDIEKKITPIKKIISLVK